MNNAEREILNERAAYMTLSEYLAQLSGLIEELDGLPGWIVCELAKVSWSRGHCYLELVESGERGVSIAKARGTIWASRAAVLNNVFRMGTGDDLREGIKVMLYVQVRYSAVYGLSLNVLDLNPSYTLGDMEARRRQTVQRLEKEGLLQRNKELAVPLLPYRIAVVSAEGAAGYGDFMKHLADSGIGFEVELFASPVQGAEAPSGIAEAFEKINARSGEFDVAVLIRGGGSNLDLVCFDDYIAAKAVALCNLPVICGIGHERDNHICDDVASVRVKTPTGAADYLVQRYADAHALISEAQHRLEVASADLLDYCSRRISGLGLRLSSALGSFAQQRTSGLKDCLLRLSRAFSVRLVEEAHRIDFLCYTRLSDTISRRMTEENYRLDKMQALFAGADPTHILDKGYGIVLKDGQKVSDIAQIEEGSRLTILMKDGKATLTATDINLEKRERE